MNQRNKEEHNVLTDSLKKLITTFDDSNRELSKMNKELNEKNKKLKYTINLQNDELQKLRNAISKRDLPPIPNQRKKTGTLPPIPIQKKELPTIPLNNKQQQEESNAEANSTTTSSTTTTNNSLFNNERILNVKEKFHDFKELIQEKRKK